MPCLQHFADGPDFVFAVLVVPEAVVLQLTAVLAATVVWFSCPPAGELGFGARAHPHKVSLDQKVVQSDPGSGYLDVTGEI